MLFRGGLVFQARVLVYHSTLGSRVIKVADAAEEGGGQDICKQPNSLIIEPWNPNPAPSTLKPLMLHRGYSNPHGARPVHQNHPDDRVFSDQYVVNKGLSLSAQGVRNLLKKAEGETHKAVYRSKVLPPRTSTVHP